VSSRHRGRRSALPAPVLALAIVAIAFFALPLVGLLWRAPWSSAWSYLTDDGALTALRLSVVCSLWATGLSIVFGVPLAWLLARVEFRGRGAVRALCTLSMVLPPVVGGVALFFALGRRGLVGQYLDRWFDVRAADVNGYLRDGIGDDASAKDFRTWHATVLAATGLASREVPGASTPQRTVDRAISGMVRDVAEAMGNTPAVCRRSYIDPRVIDRYREGRTIAEEVAALPDDAPARWTEDARRDIELAVLALLRGDERAQRAA